MKRLYVILGCTASGKAAAGLEIARRLGAEIVVVDSMKIYRRMNIGTAKPSLEAQSTVPHHCIDLVEPSESFSVAQFVRTADEAIDAITDAGKIPIAAGGTSLYLKGLCEGLFEGPSSNQELRDALRSRIQKEGLTQLHHELTQVDPDAASLIHPNDERRIVRALEVFHTQGVPISQLQKQWDSGQSRYDCVMIGLRRDKEDQSRRINQRVKRMVEMGLVAEVETLLAGPDPLSREASAAVGYAELIAHFRGECTRDEAIERIKINTRRLAKKQRTWHRRFADVNWFDVTPDDTVESVADRIEDAICFDTDARES